MQVEKYQIDMNLIKWPTLIQSRDVFRIWQYECLLEPKLLMEGTLIAR